ncbi:unnamed protein product [Brachionus calyciflorus]|uniref:UPAR/Ly6 domain-containing protein n=1 Tax=Brachionus calyciflorus TaxID=104777 RepID=A0A813SRR9_9BILA|nr:unnamed protein product [Brachionus calyciflorus]
MNALKLTSFLILIIMVTKTVKALKCYSCYGDCTNQYQIAECAANDQCAGVNYSYNGQNSNLAGCIDSSYCSATQDDVKYLISLLTGESADLIKINKAQCCGTDLCINGGNNANRNKFLKRISLIFLLFNLFIKTLF